MVTVGIAPLMSRAGAAGRAASAARAAPLMSTVVSTSAEEPPMRARRLLTESDDPEPEAAAVITDVHTGREGRDRSALEPLVPFAGDCAENFMSTVFCFESQWCRSCHVSLRGFG